MASASLSATSRSGVGTGDARKLRQGGEIPAVVYGHGRDPQSITVNAREMDRLLSQFSAGSTVIELNVAGSVAKTLIREIQRHPVKRNILHLDFQQLVAGEKITVSIPLKFVGTADGVRNSGGILEEIIHVVHLRVDPSQIPNHIDVDVTPLTIGHSIHVRDLNLPEGVVVLDEPGATVCVCAAPKTAAEDTPAAAESVEGTGVAEPELIRKPKPEEEAEKK
jgi:large subunit ribosomal protein L25